LTVDWNRQNYAGDDPEKHPAVEALRDNLPNAVTEVGNFRGEVWVYVDPERCIDVLTFLHDDKSLQFDFLSDLTATHWPDRKENQFDIVYQLYSIPNRQRFRVKTSVSDDVGVQTATSVWLGADWLEREVYDMFGVPFQDHPDQRRILNPEGFEGHPLRKDFPVKGKVRW